MALTYKKLSELADMTSANIDTTTKLVVTTGSTKVNNNLKVTDLIVDDLSTNNSYRALSAKQGYNLDQNKAPIANPTFTGTVSGITKAMVGLGNVDNTSDANKPVSTAQANTLAPKVNPTFSGIVTIPTLDVIGGSFYYNGSSFILNDLVGDNIIFQTIGSDITLNKDAGETYAKTQTSTDDSHKLATTKFVQAQKNNPTFTGVVEYADNAAAITGGLVAGNIYRTADVLKIVHS